MSTDYDADWLDDEWGDELECTYCDGEALVECNDSLCGYAHPADGFHRCPACSGSGNRADQRFF